MHLQVAFSLTAIPADLNTSWPSVEDALVNATYSYPGGNLSLSDFSLDDICGDGFCTISEAFSHDGSLESICTVDCPPITICPGSDIYSANNITFAPGFPLFDSLSAYGGPQVLKPLCPPFALFDSLQRACY